MATFHAAGYSAVLRAFEDNELMLSRICLAQSFATWFRVPKH